MGKPNVVYILADDMGYGDMACNNSGSKIPTPNLDRLAAQGMRFTDAHAPSSVCTPSRYAVLTGRYCWRTRLKGGVLWPWDPALIESDRLTVAELLRQNGYRTACIGKWHLGWNWQTVNGEPANQGAGYGVYDKAQRYELGRNIDYEKPIGGGPIDCGFDYYFGDDVPNFPPYTWFEQDRLVTQPTEEKPDGMFGHVGAMAPGWKLEAVMPEITRRSVNYIEESGEEEPFFLYFPLTAPHTPIVPTDEFRGRSGCGEYGDYVCESTGALGRSWRRWSARGLRTTRCSCLPVTMVRKIPPTAISRSTAITVWPTCAASSETRGKADTACPSSPAGREWSPRGASATSSPVTWI